MALVIVLPTIVANKVDRVALGDMFGVVRHEPLHTIPQRRNGFRILVQAKHKTVLLVILMQHPERIKRQVAEEINAGLHTPVVLVVEHQRVAEEEPGLVAAHMSITLRTAVDDFLLVHLLASVPRFVLIDPLRIRPVLLGDEAVVRVSRHHRRGEFLELLVKRFIVQEDPVIVIVSVESILDLSNGMGQFPDVLVAG